MSYDADITIVLDRSGSMSTIRNDTIGGFNTFLEEQKKNSENIRLSLIQFDDRQEVVYDNIPLSEVEPLNEKTFVPRGSTSLLDTLGMTINKTGQRFVEMDEADRPKKVIFVIITDGHENSSKEFGGPEGHKRVMEMIKHQTDKYDWNFTYLGANQDAIDVGVSLGISAGTSMSYTASTIGTRNTWQNLSNSVSRGMKGFAPTFTDAERASSMVKDESNSGQK